MTTALRPRRLLLSFPHLLRRLYSASSAAAAAEPAETTTAPISPYAGAKKKRPRKPRVPKKTLLGRISEIGSTGRKVEDVLNGYVREGNVIRKDDLFMCVRNIRKVRRFQHCNEILEWMDKRKYNYTARDHAVRVDVVAKLQGISEAEKYFYSLPSEVKNQYTYGAFLNCYCNELMVDKALALFEEMDKSNVLAALAFNNLMAMYLRLDQPEKVPCLMQDMENKNIKPNSLSKILLMRAHLMMNDIESVERVLGEIKAKGESVNWTLHSNVADMFIKAGLPEKAESSLKQLEEFVKDKKRERSAYLFLISFYATTGDHAAVLRTWDLLKSYYPDCHNMSYLNLLQAISKLGKLDDLEKFFQEWSVGCQHYDPKLANHVINTYLSHDLVDNAKQILESGSSKAISAHIKSHESFIAYYLKKEDISSALEHWEKATADVKNDQRWRPSSETIKSFFKYFLMEKDADGAKEFCTMLKKAGCLDAKAYLSLLLIYTDAGKSDLGLRRRMEEDGIEISTEHENLLKKVCPT
ncbi:hypothetical protein Droror1_Dr00022279 [Drosera rotundifolia]